MNKREHKIPQIRKIWISNVIHKFMCTNENLVASGAANLRRSKYTALAKILLREKKGFLRLGSAKVLRKLLSVPEKWEELSVTQQASIKSCILDAWLQEKRKYVRMAIIEVVSVILEKSETWMLYVVRFIFCYSKLYVRNQSELVAAGFALLAPIASVQFWPHMDFVWHMFIDFLETTKAAGNIVSSVAFNVMKGMSYLVCNDEGYKTADHRLHKALPLLLDFLREFSFHRKETFFLLGFGILDNMIFLKPFVLDIHLVTVLRFCFLVGGNTDTKNKIRIKAVGYAGELIYSKYQLIITLDLIDMVVKGLLDLMIMTDELKDSLYYVLGEEGTCPMTIATHNLRLLSSRVRKRQFLPSLFKLAHEAQQSPDPQKRRASSLSIAAVVEIYEQFLIFICDSDLKTMLSIVVKGTNDTTPWVRKEAFLDLCLLTIRLQPDITQFADQIMPIFFEFLRHPPNEQHSDENKITKVDHMFYALKMLCSNLKHTLIPYLPKLMSIVFEALHPNNSISFRVRRGALAVVSAAATVIKENMLPYFEDLTTILQMYLLEMENVDIVCARVDAINALTAVANSIGTKEFKPLAPAALRFSLNLLNQTDNSDVRVALYGLLLSLVKMLKEDMVIAYPRIIQILFYSILPKQQADLALKDTKIIIAKLDEDDLNDFTGDNDEHMSTKLDEGDVNDCNMNLIEEKKSAIRVLSACAEFTGYSFIPYIMQSLHLIYKTINHPVKELRLLSLEASTIFVIQLFKYYGSAGMTNVYTMLVLKMERILYNDKKTPVILTILNSIQLFFQELNENALTSDQLRDCIFSFITDALQHEARCAICESCNDQNECEAKTSKEEEIHDCITAILPMFGLVLKPENFAPYFKTVYEILAEKLKKGKKYNNQRAFVYLCLAQCLHVLQQKCADEFEKLCPILVSGLTDDFDDARANAAKSLAELVVHSRHTSFEAYPSIIDAIFQAVEKETIPTVRDSICILIARVIRMNPALVPLEERLPIFLQYLPLRQHFENNLRIFKCFSTLYKKVRWHVVALLQQFIAIMAHALVNKEYVDNITHDYAFDLLEKINTDYPLEVIAVATAKPEYASLLYSLRI